MSEINVSGCCHNNSTNENGMCEIYKCRCYQRYCYYKQRQQLKAENEEIRKINNANAKLMVRLRDCLDEIEEHIKTCHNTMYCKDCKFLENCQYMNGYDWSEIILQKIKQVKKGVK